MLELQCQCDQSTQVPESFVGEPMACAGCGKALRALAGGPLLGGGQRVTGRLSIVSAPSRVGEQFFLAGRQAIEVGKLPEKHLSLQGAMMSRNHCRLVPADGGWRVEDQKSTNGIFINRNRVQESVLCEGDILRVGEYEMRFSRGPGVAAPPLPEAEPEAELEADGFGSYDIDAIEATARILPEAPAQVAVRTGAPVVQLRPPGSGPECPCCQLVLAPNAKICAACGIKVPSGRPIITARGMDEDDLVERTRGWMQLVSFMSWVGLLPVASEAFGTKRARAVWILFGVTLVASALFLIANWGEHGRAEYGNLMLWSGSTEALNKKLEAKREEINQEIATAQKALKIARVRHPDSVAAIEADIDGLKAELGELDAPRPSEDFHAYQLITHAFLHQGFTHFAGNMLFLLVFGLRVNELIGDLKFALIYPLLAIAAAWSQLASVAGQDPHPMLGASGAVMGLAGMYFVFFPLQRVHMVFWFRFGWAAFYQKMFRMPGVLLLVLWIGFNDVLFMVLSKGHDHVAHWAHLGGFLTGMALAIGLIMGRLASARGADLLSVILGRHAWPLLGKPNQNLEAPIASPRGGRRIMIPGFMR